MTRSDEENGESVVMNSDDFEQRLERQTFQKIPAPWRKEILSGAEARPSRESNLHLEADPRLGWRRILSTILWPSPTAWAGLAAIWIIILGVNFDSRNRNHQVTAKIPMAREMIADLKEQEQVLKELFGAGDLPVADRPKNPAPRPRSDKERALSMA
jgi:hypothetical protein